MNSIALSEIVSNQTQNQSKNREQGCHLQRFQPCPLLGAVLRINVLAALIDVWVNPDRHQSIHLWKHPLLVHSGAKQ